jgi:hypothetical protein
MLDWLGMFVAQVAQVGIILDGLSVLQVNQQLRKRIYSTEEREARKKNRNDLKA